MRVEPIGSIIINEEGFFVRVNPMYLPGLQALEGFSHLNIIWWFSDCDSEETRNILTVPQPYKQAPATMGIFATRSPFRPNPIALTTVEVIDIDGNGIIRVAYIDADDNTPVLDIKPYSPSLDRVEAPTVPPWCRHWPTSLEASEDFDWAGEFNF